MALAYSLYILYTNLVLVSGLACRFCLGEEPSPSPKPSADLGSGSPILDPGWLSRVLLTSL